MLAFGVARDLGADHTGRVVVVLRAVHAADGALVEQLDLEARRSTGNHADRPNGRSASPLGAAPL